MTIAWRGLALLLCLMTGMAGSPARAAPLAYAIGPGSTDIDFTVDVMGLTRCRGEFRRFSGSLTLDLDQPQRSKVSVRIDANSAAMNWDVATRMVLGESYLDAGHFPEMRFDSDRVTLLGDGKVRMDGVLTLRGISHPESFVADLSDRRWDKDRNAEEADFTATGTILRTDFHMASDEGLLDDKVTFTIRARLAVGTPGYSAASLVSPAAPTP